MSPISSILVTGAAGFVGARFVESCAGGKHAVISVDEPSYFKSREEHRGIDFQTIVDRNEMFEWLERHRPALHAVVHLGACTDTTEMDAAFLNRVNVEFSKRLWSYCSRSRVPLFYASSAATFGDGSHGYSDDESGIARLKPLNPYGESKQQFDLWALDEERRGLTPPAWAGFKFFNVYGFGERHKEKMASVILHAFDQIRDSKKLRLFKSYRPEVADGWQARDFVYVGDAVKVLWFAIETGLRRGIFNLGTGKARTYLDLGRAVFAELGVKENIEFIDMPDGIAARYQYFTQAEMKRLQSAGYRAPFTPLEEGVRAYLNRLLSAAGAAPASSG